MQKSTRFRCFCGKPSIEVDTWFHWYPCEDHKHLTPNEYKKAGEDINNNESTF